MKKIALLHPFTAKAIGMEEHDLLRFHSRPHGYALKRIQDDGYVVFIDYFTGKFIPYVVRTNNIVKRFWPLSSISKNRFKWLKEKSILHTLYYNFNMPDLSIINVSGNGSPYVFKLAKKIRKNNKAYITMIGGTNVNLNTSTLDYYKNADRVIVHTNRQKVMLKSETAFNDVEIDVVPLGVDVEVFKPNVSLKANNIELLYVGRVTPLKQIELAIKAVNDLVNIHKIPNVKLNIIGPIEDYNYLNQLNNLVNIGNTEHIIKFISSKSMKELIPYYQSATLLLLPSKHESFGMVIVEAMSCGTPVFALETAMGPSEIITHLEDGILSTKDNFKDDLLSIVNQPDTIKKIAIKARQKVLEHYSLNATYQSLIDSIRKVLD